MESLHAWHEFYLLLGTAGATLLALLFVAVSLGSGFLSNKDQRGTRTFMSPVVIHFTSVFFVSAICLLARTGFLRDPDRRNLSPGYCRVDRHYRVGRAHG